MKKFILVNSPIFWDSVAEGENYLSPDEVPALLDDETPQQLLMSAFRKYRK